MDVPKALEHTQRVADLLTNRQDNPSWRQALDVAFLQAAFDHKHQQPCFNGPDGITYFGLIVPDVGEIAVVRPQDHLDYMVDWVMGAAILTPEGQAAWVYSPGDVVSLKLHGTSAYQWKGNWNELPDVEAYSQGGAVYVGEPNEHMLPPFAARCLEFAMRQSYRRRPPLTDREPGVAVLRLGSRMAAEDPSELTLNVTQEDLESADDLRSLFTLAAAHLPRYVANRLISSNHRVAADFTSLREIVLKAGLTLAPDR
jgi:hypothetical protein